MPRLIAVVGDKHSGKTTIIEHLIEELTRRGYHVGTIKEMVRVSTLDTPQKETDRYRKAGAQAVVAVPREETVIFLPKRLGVKEILPHLLGLDFVLLEGFESAEKLPKIVAAKTVQEAQSFMDKSVVALSGILADSDQETKKAASLACPLYHSTREICMLATLVEAKAVKY
ncbi:MAG: molybdopterin-guanine dinucleotide biosynthesis protein B [Candidatus Bathyarchaeota archaeon]|nr:molybdopterin-guanine dinucleotide biosynthesis protein B [Candidatus Bathyarchaeota archaeon]